MEKDSSILKLIERLKLVINFTQLEVIDYWDADLCAIGLKKGNRLVYISTFNYIEKNESGYDFDLEIIHDNSKEKIDIIKEGISVSEGQLIDEIKLFLGV